MELKNAITERRAIRQFKDEAVSRDTLERIMENSRFAPVVAAFRSWEFVVVSGSKRDRMADLLTQNTVILRDLFAMMDPDSEKKALEYYRNLGDAPVLVFVTIPKLPDENRWEYSFANIAATTELMLMWLLAEDEGLGACGITVPPYIGDQILSELEIDGREILCGLSLGYPDEQPAAKPHPRVKVTYINDESSEKCA